MQSDTRFIRIADNSEVVRSSRLQALSPRHDIICKGCSHIKPKKETTITNILQYSNCVIMPVHSVRANLTFNDRQITADNDQIQEICEILEAIGRFRTVGAINLGRSCEAYARIGDSSRLPRVTALLSLPTRSPAQPARRHQKDRCCTSRPVFGPHWGRGATSPLPCSIPPYP